MNDSNREIPMTSRFIQQGVDFVGVCVLRNDL